MKTVLLMLMLYLCLPAWAQSTQHTVKKKTTTSSSSKSTSKTKKRTTSSSVKKPAVTANKSSGKQIKYFKGTQNQFENLLRDSSKPGIIFVVTGNCWQCERYENNVLRSQAIINIIDSSYYIYKVDAGENPDIVFQNELNDIPALLMLDTNGRITDRLEGTADADKVKKFLKSGL
jgi:thioredoxin-like negative regulator of GroEL